MGSSSGEFVREKVIPTARRVRGPTGRIVVPAPRAVKRGLRDTQVSWSGWSRRLYWSRSSGAGAHRRTPHGLARSLPRPQAHGWPRGPHERPAGRSDPGGRRDVERRRRPLLQGCRQRMAGGQDRARRGLRLAGPRGGRDRPVRSPRPPRRPRRPRDLAGPHLCAGGGRHGHRLEGPGQRGCRARGRPFLSSAALSGRRPRVAFRGDVEQRLRRGLRGPALARRQDRDRREKPLVALLQGYGKALGWAVSFLALAFLVRFAFHWLTPFSLRWASDRRDAAVGHVLRGLYIALAAWPEARVARAMRAWRRGAGPLEPWFRATPFAA